MAAVSAWPRDARGAWLAIALPDAGGAAGRPGGGPGGGSGDELQGLALWAMRYSPLVSLCRNVRLCRGGVVAEVAGSAHLFGGIDRLLADARAGVLDLSPDATCAAAPTAAGAWALACCCDAAGWVDAAQWPARLARLPLSVLDMPGHDHNLLAGIGLHTIGDCMALPRGDLDRRCGSTPSVQLDRLSGRASDPRRWFTPPSDYDRAAELLHETWHADAILFTGRRLLAELEGLLRGSGRAVQRLRFSLGHAPGQPETVFELALTRPLQNLAPVTALLRERLARLRLPSPVRRVQLQSTPLDAWQPQSPELWPGPAEAALQRDALLDRLRARLGAGAVSTLEAVADHRPEVAWRATPVDAAKPRQRNIAKPNCRGLRPLWLLPTPSPLDEIPGDWLEERGPERIESGWWENPAARDYYVLRDSKGRRLWAYRTSSGSWFAHGWFA